MRRSPPSSLSHFQNTRDFWDDNSNDPRDFWDYYYYFYCYYSRWSSQLFWKYCTSRWWLASSKILKKACLYLFFFFLFALLLLCARDKNDVIKIIRVPCIRSIRTINNRKTRAKKKSIHMHLKSTLQALLKRSTSFFRSLFLIYLFLSVIIYLLFISLSLWRFPKDV